VLAALATPLDWLRDSPGQPSGDRETVLRQLAAPPTFEAKLDDGQYIDYLLSVQALARQAQEEGLGLLYVQWDGGDAWRGTDDACPECRLQGETTRTRTSRAAMAMQPSLRPGNDFPPMLLSDMPVEACSRACHRLDTRVSSASASG
jgi:hypothetical protein